MKVKVKKLTENAILPKYSHPGDAGLDVYSAEPCTLAPMERKLVSTGISIALPKGYEAQIRPRSGLAIKHGIGVVNSPGTIDAGYRGEVKIILINLSEESFEIEAGKRIAQMVVKKVEAAELIEVDDLDETMRGSGGFGSTGVH